MSDILNDSLEDSELMQMYQNGSEEAFALLYRRHSPKVYGYLKAKLKNEEKAQDIFQEVFVKVHRSKHLYNKKFPVLPWFFTIAHSSLIDHLRKKDLMKLVPEEELDLAATSGEISSEVDLSSGLSRLSEAQKKAVELRYIDERTFEEIADQLETSPENVRQLVSRGVQRLRSILKSGVRS